MNQPHIHTPSDGRGGRNAYLNGNLVRRVVYADTKKGYIRVTDDPPKLDKYGKRVISRTLRGKVEVVPQ